MLALWREIDLFLGDIGLRQIPKGAGNETVSRFFCAGLEIGINQSIKQVITFKITRK